MSAICGYINLGADITAGVELLNKMKRPFSKYDFDDVREELEEIHYGFAYFNQFHTEESTYEILPYIDENAGIVMIADCILDNREELANKIEVDIKSRTFTDSQLILRSYFKWGKDCLNYLIGDFTFVIFNRKTNTIFIARDHVGKRILYYRFENGIFEFSTLIDSLLSISTCNNENSKLNQKWLVEFFSHNTILHELTENETLIKDVYHVKAGHYIEIHDGMLNEVKYWYPEKIKKIKNIDRAIIYNQFKTIYEVAVKRRLRTTGKVGISLSSGLDSASVACIASDILKEENQCLYSYTAIPIAGYKEWLNKYQIADESSHVEELVKMKTNIIPKYFQAADINSYKVIDELIDVLEQPYKMIENSYWLIDVIKNARNDGCTILLDGQFGNSTVSNGNFIDIINEQFQNHDYLKLINGILDFCDDKKLAKIITLKRFLNYLFYTSKNNNSLYDYKIVLDSYKKKYNVYESLINTGHITKKRMTFDDKCKLSLHGCFLNHLSAFEVKIGLKYKVLKRDPTRDKDLIEFCYSLPYYYYFDKGVDRALIRKNYKDDLPESIINNYKFKGKQGADWLQRLQPDWDQIISELRIFIDNPNNRLEFLDYEILNELMRLHTSITPNYESVDGIRTLISILTLYKYLDRKED